MNMPYKMGQKPITSRVITPRSPCIRPCIGVRNSIYINYNGNLMVDQIPNQFLFFFGTIAGDLTGPGSVDQPHIMWILGRGCESFRTPP